MKVLTKFDGTLPSKPHGGLRFGLKSEIECRNGPGDWLLGEVTGHYYRQENFPEGYAAAYQVKTVADDGTERMIFICQDNGESVREPGLTAWTKSEVDAAKLRVRFDDAVRINVGTKREPQWEAGCVTAVKYTQDDIPAGYVAAYQVRMESTGQLYLCKRDKSSFILEIDADSDEEWSDDEEEANEGDIFTGFAEGEDAEEEAEAKGAEEDEVVVDADAALSTVVQSIAMYSRKKATPAKKRRLRKQGAAPARQIVALRLSGHEGEKWNAMGVYGIGGDQAKSARFKQEVQPAFMGVSGLQLIIRRNAAGKWVVETPLFYRSGVRMEPKELIRSTTAAPSPVGLEYQVLVQQPAAKKLTIGDDDDAEEEEEEATVGTWELDKDIVFEKIPVEELNSVRAEYRKHSMAFAALDYAAVEISGHGGKFKNLMGVYKWNANLPAPIFVKEGAAPDGSDTICLHRATNGIWFVSDRESAVNSRPTGWFVSTSERGARLPLALEWDVATLATESDPAGWETEPRLKVTMLSKDDIEARKKAAEFAHWRNIALFALALALAAILIATMNSRREAAAALAKAAAEAAATILNDGADAAGAGAGAGAGAAGGDAPPAQEL